MTPAHFQDALPAKMFYDPQRDMWVRLLADGRVEIGATAFGLHLAGAVIAFTPKPIGAKIDLGRGLGTIETGKTVLAVHCPLSICLDEANEAAEENAAILERSPYAAGWMVRGKPRDWAGEQKHLVNAAAYRAHCLSISPDAAITVSIPESESA